MLALGMHNEIWAKYQADSYLFLNVCVTGCTVPDQRIRLFGNIWLHYNLISRG